MSALALLAAIASTASAVAPTEDLARLEIATAPAAVGVVGADPSLAPTESAREFWSTFEAVTGQGWAVQWNLATGVPHRAIPARYDAAVSARVIPAGTSLALRGALLDAAAVDRMARDTYETIALARPANAPGAATLPAVEDLRPLAIEKQGGVWWAIYEQTLDGLPVEGARADFRFSEDGHLLHFGLRVIPGAAPAGAALIDEAGAQEIAMAALVRAGLSADALAPSSLEGVLAPGRNERDSMVAAGPVLSPYLAYLPLYAEDGLSVELRLAQVVRTEVSAPPARFRTYVDAVTGEVLRRENEFHYLDFSGQAESEVHPTNPADAPVTLDQRDLRVTVVGLGDVMTNPDGTFSLNSPDAFPRTVRSALTGSWVRIDDASGAEPLYQSLQSPGTPFVIHWNAANSDASERDTFHHTNVIHTWQKNVDPDFTGVDYEMFAHVNVAGSCNAFWDGSSINFYRAGGGCVNIGEIADVIYHEYGHGTNQFVFAPVSPSGAEHEGMADYQAATISDQPLIGIGFFGPGSSLRTCDNDRQWPAPECGGEPHCVGEVIAGALWHMRENLVARLGQSAGVELADDLFHYARYGRDQSFDGYYFDILALDDDNGSLADGTPHAREIVAAFDRHNIGPGWALEILHAQLGDTDNTVDPRDVTAVFSTPADLLPGSPAVHYATGPIGGAHGAFTRLEMVPTGEIREFQASIPAQPWGTEVSYYLEGAADTLGISATLPVGAPANTFSYRVEEDTQVPQVDHEVLADKSFAIWPVVARAEVSDNQSIGAVEVEWSRNGSPQSTFELSSGDGLHFDGVFSAGADEGDQIAYRIKASDGATPPNVRYEPAAGYHELDVVHDYADEMEDGEQDWTHAVGTEGFVDSWHLSTERNVTSGGSHSWKFGQVDGGYLDSSDGVLLTAPVRLGLGAGLAFQHWIDAEVGGGSTAWDGAVVELSQDGGDTWELIVPDGGYTHTIIENPASPFPPGYPCWSGSYGWRLAEFDLSIFAGLEAQIRLRFGSDGYVTGAGWFIDSMVLDPGTGTSDAPGVGAPLETTLLGAIPNPFHAGSAGARGAAGAEMRFALAEGSPVTLEILDVTGRRVRTLVRGPLAAGWHSATWDGRSEQGLRVGSGVYFLRLTDGKVELTEKVLLTR